MCQQHITKLTEQYPDIIEMMSEQFDSHEFILKLAHDNQQEYIEALYEYRENPAPFRTLHAILSRALHSHRDRVEDLGTAKTNNIWMESNDCHLWRKKDVIS